MLVALRSLLAAVVLVAAFAPAAHAQDPACERTWSGGDGNWNDASHWSGGAAPNQNERGCLPAGAYTVTVTAGTSPKGVTVGAGVTVLLKAYQYVDARAASFLNRGTVRLEQNATLYGPLRNEGTVEDTGDIPPGNNRPTVIGSVTNTGTIRANQGLNLTRNDGAVESTGRLETATATSLLNGWGYPSGSWTVGGTIVNPGTMQFQGGTMQVRTFSAQSGNAPKTYDSKLDLTVAVAATLEVNNTVDLVSDVPAGVTVNVMGRDNDANLRLDGARTNRGTIVLDSAVTFRQGQLNAVAGTPRLTNAGTLRLKATAAGDRTVSIPFDNTGTLTVDASARLVMWGDGTTRASTTSGAYTVAGSVWYPGFDNRLTQTGGTMTITGSVLFQGGTYVHQGGTMIGELQLGNNATYDPSGPGAAAYRVLGYTTLTGDVHADATVTVEANGGQPGGVTLTRDTTVAGRMIFTSSGAFAQDTQVGGLNGVNHRLTITGRVEIRQGTFGGTRHFTLPLTVAPSGTLSVGDGGRMFVNGNGTTAHELAGRVEVDAGGLLLWRIQTQTVTQTAGTIDAAGSFVVEGNTFKHAGGTIAGLVRLSSGQLRGRLDPSGPGTSAYIVYNSVDLVGDVHADADIQIGLDTGTGGALYLTERDVTNRGSIQVGPEAGTPPVTLSDFGQPYTLTNAGSLTTGTGGGRTLDVRMVNTGTLTINEYTTGISSIADKPLVTNSGGTVTVKAAFSSWRGYTQTSGLTDIAGGSLGSPRTPADIRIEGGRLRGVGTLYGPVTNAATVEVGRPGSAYGKLQIKDVVDQIVRVAASYTQTAAGRLAVDAGGTVAGTSFDQLTVDGPATLAGALDVATAAGYTPNPATPDRYRVLLSESRAGTFADLTGGRLYTLAHDTTGAELTARVPPPPSAELSIAGASVTEGAGALTFTVKLSKAATDPVSVDWAAEDDSAAAGADYSASSGTLAFPAGATEGTITVPVTNDAVVEPVKELLVRLRRPVNATLAVATATGRIDPDDLGIATAASNRVGNTGNATIVVTGGGFGAGTTAKLTRAGHADRPGVITAGPERQSKLSARFDMRGAAEGAWTLVIGTPKGTTTTPITVQSGAPALHSYLSLPGALRYGWAGRAVLSIRNAGGDDVGLDGVRFRGADLELRAIGATDFSNRLALSGDELGDALVIPALSTRTVAVEVRSTTTVPHAFMTVEAEIYPAGYLSQTVTGSDPDPGTGSITGRVTTAAGQPVRDLRVTAFDGAHSASAKTDGSGAYTLAPLKPGNYAVEAGGAKGSAVVGAGARTVDLVTGVAELSGTVGKSDATVALLRDGRAVATVAADATGGFRFRVAKPGAYRLVADSPSAGRAGRDLTVAAGADQPGLALTLGTRALRVHTTAGATVRVWPAGEQELPSTRTATGGTATFAGLPAGALTVEVRAAGKAPARATAAAGEADVTVTPAEPRSISGRVTAAGAPVETAIVVAAAGGEQRLAVTGADGRYAIAGLAAGAYDVWVLAPGAAPLAVRGVTAGATNADAAVTTAGTTLDVKVGAGALGRLVQLVDPATGVPVATSGTVGPEALARFGPLPAGTYSVQAAGAASRTVTLGAGAGGKARAAAAQEETVTLDEDGYPVVADPEPDPAYEEYTSPFSGLKAPQLNEKDRLGWDQILPDYPGPCPTADRIYDQIHLKQKAKLLAFSAWVDAWDAADSQNRADIERLLTLSAQFTANTALALATMAKMPPGVSGAAAGAIGNLANYIGTMHASNLGVMDPLAAADYAGYFKDAVDTVASFAAESSGQAIPLSYLSSVVGILRSLIDISDQARAFPQDVAARGFEYLEAQRRYEQLIREINTLLNQFNEAKKHCPELVDRGPKAPVRSGGQIENIMSNDPNEILGPKGAGEPGWIPRAQALGYSIRFENLGPGSVIPPGQQPASAPAVIVKVVTTLSPAVDVEQVTLGGVGWGAVELPVPPGLTRYHADVPQAGGDIVRVDGALDKATRTITWTLKTIDPATGEVNGSPTAGFLPPEDGTRRGQGHVDYVAGSADALAQGTAIAAKATITFDVNAPIETNTHTNTVDASAPAATLTLAEASCDGKLPVSWSGTDSGSGVAAYDVEVSTDGARTWRPWLAGTDATSGSYPGVPGQPYAFRVTARDAVGNQEAAPGTPDATVTLGPCDLEAPRTTATLPGGAVGGWYSGPVDVRLDAVDAPGGSGVTALRVSGREVAGAAATERVSAEGVTDLTFSARDAKGNVERDAHLPVRIDTTAPAIAIASPEDGATYALGQAVAAGVECSDAGSGVAACDAPATVDTSAPGTHTFTARARDRLGHETALTRTYTVAAAPPPGSPPGGGTPPPGGGGSQPPLPAFGSKPITVKLGKVTRRTVQAKLTSREAFAFTGRATLLTPGRKPKAQSKAGTFSLAAGKSRTLTLTLNPAGGKALRSGRKVKLVLRLELRTGTARKTVDVKVTLRAR